MANKVVETVIRGKLQYAKLLGEPRLNYNRDGKEWTTDLELINQATIKEIKSLGIGDRIKQREDRYDGAPYLTLKQKELRADGTPNKPVRVVEADGKTPWDENKLLGNDTVADVKVAIIDYGPGKKAGVYIRGVRVLDLVEYSPKLFDDLDEDDEYFAGEGSYEEKEPEVKAKSRGKAKEQDKAPWKDELDDDIEF